MLRPRAPVGRATVVVPLLGLLLGLAGCGSSEEENTADEPSRAAAACRAKWNELGADVEGRDAATNPSALPQRWNNIAATVDYYAASAASEDCGKRLEEQEVSMDALASFTTKLKPFDMELEHELVQTDAQRYASGPRRPGAPRPAEVARALQTLTRQAPLATQQQRPGWQQASVADLGDTAAVAKAVKDLAFLSSESAAYRACNAALRLVTRALASAN